MDSKKKALQILGDYFGWVEEPLAKHPQGRLLATLTTAFDEQSKRISELETALKATKDCLELNEDVDEMAVEIIKSALPSLK